MASSPTTNCRMAFTARQGLVKSFKDRQSIFFVLGMAINTTVAVIHKEPFWALQRKTEIIASLASGRIQTEVITTFAS